MWINPTNVSPFVLSLEMSIGGVSCETVATDDESACVLLDWIRDKLRDGVVKCATWNGVGHHDIALDDVRSRFF